MKLKDITERFFRMEEELKLFQKSISGVYIWENIRWEVHRLVLRSQQVFQQKKSGYKDKLYLRLIFLFSSFNSLFAKNPFFINKCEILFWGHPRRKQLEGGLWWDLYSDPVIDQLSHKFKCALIEPAFNGKHFQPAKTKDIYYLDFLSLCAAILRKLRVCNVKLTSDDLAWITETQKNLEKIFSIQINNFRNIIIRELNKRNTLLPFYRYVLKKSQPKLVFIVCSYNNEVFIEACKSLKIPIVELQHGTSVGRLHPGYSFSGESVQKRNFPDYFFTFGNFWSQRGQYPIEFEKVKSVGFPYFEQEKAKYAESKKKKQIVFLSQPAIGKSMSRFALELCQNIDPSIKVLYKLHPIEYTNWHKAYPYLLNSKIEVISGDGIPLYKLLAESMAQVGVYSTVVYEGLGFGLKTFLINLPGVDYMQELIEAKRVELVDSPNELIDKLAVKTNTDSEANPLFKQNSLENIEVEAQQIINYL